MVAGLVTSPVPGFVNYNAVRLWCVFEPVENTTNSQFQTQLCNKRLWDSYMFVFTCYTTLTVQLCLEDHVRRAAQLWQFDRRNSAASHYLPLIVNNVFVQALIWLKILFFVMLLFVVASVFSLWGLLLKAVQNPCICTFNNVICLEPLLF